MQGRAASSPAAPRITMPFWRRILSRGAAFLFFLLLTSRLTHWETQRWWFAAEGYEELFSTYMAWRGLAFTVTFLLFASILSLLARRAWKTAANSHAPLGLGTEAGNSARLIPLEDKLGLDRYRRAGTAFYILLVAWAAGMAAATRYDIWLRAWHAKPLGVSDKLWDRDISIYLWYLPALEALSGLIFGLLWTSLLLCTLIYVYEEAVEVGGRRLSASPAAARHLGALLGLLIAMQAVSYRLAMWDLQSATAAFKPEGAANFGAPEALCFGVLHVLSWLALLVGAATYWLFARGLGKWACLAVLLFWSGGWLTTRLAPVWARSGPGNAAVDRSGAFYAAHLQATRDAWGLGEITSYQAQEAEQPQLPLWPEALIADEVRRRLDQHHKGLILSSLQLETWWVGQSRRLVYVVVCQSSPQAGATADRPSDGLFVVDAGQKGRSGAPVFYLEPGKAPTVDLSPLGPGAPSLPVRSRLALNVGTWSPGRTAPRQRESLPGTSGLPEDVLATQLDTQDMPLPRTLDPLPLASGGGRPTGVALDSAWRRGLMAYRFLNPDLLFTTSPRLLWHRRVVDRCRQLAPFLDWNHGEPRLVSLQARPVWVLSGLAWSRRYPGAALAPSFSGNNYVRAVAYATVDAESGETRFYLASSQEPFSGLYHRAFPQLWRDMSLLPAQLRRELRTNPTVFAAQSEIWATYGQHLRRKRDGYTETEPWSPALQPLDAPSRLEGVRQSLRRALVAAKGSTAQAPTDTQFLLSSFSRRLEITTLIEEDPPLGLCSVLLAREDGEGRYRLLEWRPPSPIPVEGALSRESTVRVVMGRPVFPPPTLISFFPGTKGVLVTRGSRQPRPSALAGPPYPGTGQPAGTTRSPQPAPPSLKETRTWIGWDGKPLRSSLSPPHPDEGAAKRLRQWEDSYRSAREAQERGDFAGFERIWRGMQKYIAPKGDS